MPRPAVVMFDLDGTLVDHDSASRKGLTGWLTDKQWATQADCESGLVALWDEVAERHFPAFRAGEITFQEQRRRRLRDFLPHLGVHAEPLADGALDLIFDDYLRHYESAWSAFRDARPCLVALQGLRLAVLSNGDQRQQEDKLRRTGLLQYFEVVMTSSGLGAAKPHPEAYRLACDHLAVDPATVVYVGDRLDVDAQASTSAGLHGVWLDRQCSSDSCYHPTINTLQNLPELLG